MKESPWASLAAVAACGVMLGAGCGEDVHSSVGGCDITVSVGFHGREYTWSERPAERGRRVGFGEMAACPGEEPDRVRAFRVVGLPSRRAVYVEPYGLMLRSHFDSE